MNRQLSTAFTLMMGLTGLAFTSMNAMAAPTEPLVYVSHQDGPLGVYRASDLNKVADIDVGVGARGLGISRDGRLLVVAVKETNDLAIVDTLTRQVVRRVPVGVNPEFVRVLGDKAFVAYEPSAKGGPPPKPGSKEAKALKAEREDDDKELPAKVAIVDLKTGKKLKEITAGFETEGIEFSADGRFIVVTNEADENVSVHSIKTGRLIKRIDTSGYGLRPRGVKRSPDGRHYAVTLEYGNKVLILDKQFKVVKEVATGEVPYGVTYSRDGREIYVALSKGKAIQVFDANSLALKREIPVGERCWHFSFTPDDERIVAACGRSKDLLVLNPITGQTLQRISENTTPWGVVMSTPSVGSLETP